MHLRKEDEIEPQTKIYLETLNKLKLNDVQYINFQGFAFKKRDFVQKPAIDAPIEISPVKFYKLHSFKENDYFDTDAMMVTLIEKDLPNMPIHVSAADIERALRQKEQPNATPHKSKESNKPTVIEVDLHINELLDSVAGLSNAEILRVQMDKFNEVMRSNQKKKGQKIVFIHGKGEGVLRKEIEKELRRSYKSCYYQDASFQQYGFGATQVTIR